MIHIHQSVYSLRGPPRPSIPKPSRCPGESWGKRELKPWHDPDPEPEREGLVGAVSRPPRSPAPWFTLARAAPPFSRRRKDDPAGRRSRFRFVAFSGGNRRAGRSVRTQAGDRLCEKLHARVGIETHMTRLRSSLLAAVLGLSLTAPAVAACSDCCPRGEAEPTVAALPACCEQCAPTLEKRDTAAPCAAKRAIVDRDSIWLIEDSVIQLGRSEAFQPGFPSTAPLRPGSRLDPLHLRL